MNAQKQQKGLQKRAKEQCDHATEGKTCGYDAPRKSFMSEVNFKEMLGEWQQSPYEDGKRGKGKAIYMCHVDCVK